jgi:hypothetical protein
VGEWRSLWIEYCWFCIGTLGRGQVGNWRKLWKDTAGSVEVLWSEFLV